MARYSMKGPSPKAKLTAAIATRAVAYRGVASKKRPARFNNSKKRYTVNKQISSALRKFAETKYLPLRKLNVRPPSLCQDTKTGYFGWTLGSTLPLGWDANLASVGGIQCQQGSTGGLRDGNYIYLMKSHFTMNIDMLPAINASGSTSPTEFRLIVCKQRRSVYPAGFQKLPQNTLFLDVDNSDFGYLSGTASTYNGTDYFRQPINKRDWVVYKDQRFFLTPPPYIPDPPASLPLPLATFNQKFSQTKTFQMNLPYYKKVQYENVNNLPTDIDFNYLIICFAKSHDKAIEADNWRVNMRGTTTFQDT